MKFYIELDGVKTYRLQSNGKWREVKSTEILETDYTTSDVHELVTLQSEEYPQTETGESLKTKATHKSSSTKELYYYHVFVIRDMFPLIPSKEQLISTIRYGDDRVSNSLILNTYGYFELRDFRTLNISIADPTIVCRYQTFSAENGYIGEEPSMDKRFVDGIYKEMLEFWLGHLRKGFTDVHSIGEPKTPIESILVDIKAIEAEYDGAEIEDE
jgi:hypothetical protein